MKLIYSLFIAILLAACQSGPDAPVVTIIHTNDTHSQIDPDVRTERGGVVERAAMLEYFRSQTPDLMYLDAGDMVQGSPYFNIFKGELEFLCMDQQQLIATTFGNHEFDNGLTALDTLLSKSHFQLISSNYHCENTILANLVKPHLILNNNGVKVGITGVTTNPEGLIFSRYWEGITYENPVTAVNREAKILREEGCDLVVVLSHVGYMPQDSAMDVEIALKSQDIDIIIGAHSHVNIEDGLYVNNQNGQPVLITQTGGKANPMGYLAITMKRGSDYENCKYSVDSIVCKKLHPEEIFPDEKYEEVLKNYGKDMAEFIKPYTDRVATAMNEVIGFAPRLMEKGRPQGSLGNFAADALRIMGEKNYGHSMDLGLTNNGGLRNVLPDGDVTVGAIYSIFPFDNELTILEMKGSDVLDLINSLAGRKLEAMSGMNVTLELDGNRTYASSIKIGGKPVDPNRIYYIATIDYLAEGNSGMGALTKAVKTTKTGIMLRDLMIDYVRQLTAEGKEIWTDIDDRVIDKAFKKK